MLDIQFTGKNFQLSEVNKEQIKEKIQKHEKLLEKATSIAVLVESLRNYKSKDENFKVEISVHMPHAFIKVEGKGPELRMLIDSLEATLKRRLKRYYDQFKRWEKEEPWKAKELKETLEEAENLILPEYNDYVPEIRYKQYEDERPMHPAEAIEQMELLGHNSFLFKNIETSKYSMIYKREDGEYGLVEPKHGR